MLNKTKTQTLTRNRQKNLLNINKQQGRCHHEQRHTGHTFHKGYVTNKGLNKNFNLELKRKWLNTLRTHVGNKKWHDKGRDRMCIKTKGSGQVNRKKTYAEHKQNICSYKL